MSETIEINGRLYRRFIPWPKPVRDGTVRCFACGQIDEPEWHDDKRCRVFNSQEAADGPE